MSRVLGSNVYELIHTLVASLAFTLLHIVEKESHLADSLHNSITLHTLLYKESIPMSCSSDKLVFLRSSHSKSFINCYSYCCTLKFLNPFNPAY